jgi:hypothetical protein
MTAREIRRVQLEPDLVLPTQFLQASIATPEKRLLLAVLEEAVGTYQRHVTDTDRDGRAVFADVQAWFASEDGAWLYSFVAICDVIGLDPTYVRTGLGQWTDVHHEPSPATEARPYRFPFRRMNGTRHRTNVCVPGTARTSRRLVQARSQVT